MKFINIILILLRTTTSKLILWSKEEYNLPALKHYKTQDFHDITKLNESSLMVFKTDFSQIPRELQDDLKLNSYYLPNAEIDFKKLKVVQHDAIITKEMYGMYKSPLVVFEEKSKRLKRFSPRYTGVLFHSQGCMLYTNRPPVLRQDTMFFTLDRCIGVRADIHPRTVDFDMEFEIEANMTVILEFKMVLLHDDEWVLATTKITDAHTDTYLLPSIKIQIKNKLSFHCSYDIHFKDMDNAVEVIFHGIQIQPNCIDGAFAAAVECTSYITATTAAALLVTLLFLVGLFFGINALLCIKTMDKFDHSDSKQLHLEDVRPY